MFKLIKFILKLVLVLVLLIVVGAVIFLAVVSDSSKSDYTPSEETKSLETILGKSIYESLEDIANIDKQDRSTSENNKITIDFSYQDLNDCATSIIRTNEAINNPTYLAEGGTTSIASAGSVSLNSITFQEIDDNFGVVARGSALGFYNTSISMALSEAPSVENNILYLKLGSLKLGNKLSISADFAKDIFKKFSLFKDSKNDYFDVENLTMHLDLNSQLESLTSSTRFSDFFKNATFSAGYTKGDNASLNLGIDTKDIFISYEDIPVASPSYSIDPLAIIASGGTVKISEEDFNYLIQSEFDEASYELEPMSLGGYNYTFGLNNFYFDLDKSTTSSSVLAEVSINSLKTMVEANVKESLTMKNDAVDELILSVQSFKLGNTTVANDNFFDKIVVSADTLTQGHSDVVKVKNVVFNREEGNVEITYAMA